MQSPFYHKAKGPEIWIDSSLGVHNTLVSKHHTLNTNTHYNLSSKLPRLWHNNCPQNKPFSFVFLDLCMFWPDLGQTYHACKTICIYYLIYQKKKYGKTVNVNYNIIVLRWVMQLQHIVLMYSWQLVLGDLCGNGLHVVGLKCETEINKKESRPRLVRIHPHGSATNMYKYIQVSLLNFKLMRFVKFSQPYVPMLMIFICF